MLHCVIIQVKVWYSIYSIYNIYDDLLTLWCVQMKVQQAVLELKLTPALLLLRSTLDQLQDRDSAKIFSQPVNLAEVSAARTRIAAYPPGVLFPL